MRDAFFVLMNRVGRLVTGVGLYMMAAILRRRIARQVDSYARDQAALRRAYEIEPDTPVVVYDESVRAAVEAYAAGEPDARFAYTSGSTSEPKKIAYTRARLRSLVAGNVSIIARMIRREDLGGSSLFILSSLKDDDSLSTLVLSDAGARVKYFDGLITPARYLTDPRLAALVEEYGACAARLWMLILADSAIVYSTNPSTLALFLTEVHDDWAGATRLVRDYAREPQRFHDDVHAVRRRVGAPGWRARFAAVAGATAPPPVRTFLPSLEVYCCWDGGYVRPFLDQIEAFLPPDEYRLMPMYSMSTETVETLNYFDDDTEVRFLPLGPGVYYEFLPDGAGDDAAQLIGPLDLEVGQTYCMVVSDGYGLRRYQTEDLFRCEAKVRGVPDLRFLRRRGIKYSFTGEKLTGEQLSEVFEALRDQLPQLRKSGIQLTCIPSRAAASTTPGYVLVLAHPGRQEPDWVGEHAADVAAAFDGRLAAANRELAAKVESGRLAPTRAVTMPYDELAAQLDPKTKDGGDASRRTYDNQFKLLPLYSRTWEELGFPSD